MDLKPFLITVPKQNRTFRVWGYTRTNAELNFVLSVTKDMPETARVAGTAIRIPREQLAFGQLQIVDDSGYADEVTRHEIVEVPST